MSASRHSRAYLREERSRITSSPFASISQEIGDGPLAMTVVSNQGQGSVALGGGLMGRGNPATPVVRNGLPWSSMVVLYCVPW